MESALDYKNYAQQLLELLTKSKEDRPTIIVDEFVRKLNAQLGKEIVCTRTAFPIAPGSNDWLLTIWLAEWEYEFISITNRPFPFIKTVKEWKLTRSRAA